MNRSRTLSRLPRNAAFLALALLALVVKVAVPTGFMVAAPGSGAGFPLVICTGHGPVVTHRADDKGENKAKPDAPCAFAGQSIALQTALAAPIGGAVYWRVIAPDHRGVGLAPGRGLAAPPPPSQAPPIIL
ncbi:MAG TPA: hypothetical protein VHY32_00330 [Caulobacteraceae bacterium]|nr:hypothetical protein [Caulobacteraceae bacterium]